MLYKAFISYSHTEDARLADALDTALRRFAAPWYRKRTLRLFRDKSSLALTHALWPSIEHALGESEFLLLLASPNAAASPWVRQEVEWWLEHRSPDSLLIVLTAGDLCWSSSAGGFEPLEPASLPPALDGAFRQEPRWLDLRWAKGDDDLTTANSRFHQAVADIAARLLDRPKDELIGEDVRQYRKNRAWAWSAAIALALAAATAIVFAVVAERRRQEAEHQRKEAERQAGIATEQANIARTKTKEAEGQRDRAERQTQIALARQLVAQAEVIRTSGAADREMSALLAVEGLRRFQNLGVRWYEADAAVRRSFALLPLKAASWQTSWPVDAIAFHDDGRRVVAATRLLGTQTWDLRTGAGLSGRHPDKRLPTVIVLGPVALSPGGKFLAAGSSSGVATVFDSATLQTLPGRFDLGDDEFTSAVAVSADGRWLAMSGRSSPGASLTLRHLPSGKEVGRVPWSHEVAFDPSGRYLAAGGGLWEVPATDPERTLRPTRLPVVPSFDVRGLSFSPDGRHLARVILSEGQKRVEVWALPEMRLLHTIDTDNYIRGVAVSTGGRYVALVGSYSIELREVTTSQSVVIQRSSTGAVAFSPRGADLAVGDENGATVWRVTSSTEVVRLGPPRELRSAEFSHNNERIVTLSRVWSDRAGTQMIKHVWNVRTSRRLEHLSQTFEPGAHGFSADGAYLAVAVKGNVEVWDVGTGRRRGRFTLSGFVARRVVLSADGRYLAALTSDRLTVWDLESNKQVVTLACGPRPGEFVFEGTTPQIALGDHGWYLARAFRRHAGRTPSDAALTPFIRLWELKLGQELFTARLGEPVFGKPDSAVALSPDGRFLAIGLQTGRVAVYELARGGTPQFHVDEGLVGFSADGHYLATSGTDVDSQTSKVYSTSDLRWFATGVAADVVHIWNVTTREEVARVRYEPGSRPVGLSRAGDYLTVLGPDGTVRIAPLEPGALLNAACGRLIRNLTVAEWRRFVGDLPPESTCPALPPPK